MPEDSAVSKALSVARQHVIPAQQDRRSAPTTARGSPPRPLHILTQALALAPSGGIETSTLQDSLALAARGHVIDVMFGADGPARDEYNAAGIDTTGPHRFAFDPRRPVGDLSAYIPAARQARRLGADVLWLNRPEHIVWGQVVSRWARIPLVCHLHHHPNYRRLRMLNTGVSHFIAVSQFIRDEWVAGGLPPERVTLLHNAIPSQRYPFGGLGEQQAARRELGLPEGIPVVLYCGRMIADKGVPTLVRAWRETGLTPEQALLVLVGGPSPDEVPEVAEELGQLPGAAYRWFPERADIVPLLHAADVVACPFWGAEPFGLVIIEAMSTGRPVIASRVGAVPEILAGKMSRFLVEPRSSTELAGRLLSLLTWRRDEPGLGVECREWVESRFPYSDHVRGLESVLQKYRRGKYVRQDRLR